MLNEESALALVKRHFPDSYVCSDEYKKLNSVLGAQYIDLRSFCLGQGFKDIRSWLIGKRMYVPMERDMRSGTDAELVGDVDPVSIARKVFATNPLLGDVVLNDGQRGAVLDYAQQVFDRIYDGGKHSPDDDVVLVLAIVLLLRKKQNAGEEKDDSFWPYIYAQFGHVHGDSSQTVYLALCKAVNGALTGNGRYIAPSGTQRYYTSLMLHALAPVGSMESLFEILLYFFTDELNYEYIPEDPAYRAIVNCIANRWDKEIEKDPDLHVRSNIIASGLKILFQDRPVFMAKFCEMLVRKIDALIRNQGSSLLKPDSYLDGLLEAWYKKIDEERREKLNREKTQTKATRRASSVENVRIQYILNDKKVALNIPAIRLETVEDEEPEFQLYQGNDLVANETLDVYGRLCWTIRQRTIDLCDYPVDFDRLGELRLVILYHGKVLVDTKKTLFRDYLIFDKNGHEIPRQSMGKGKYYVLAPENAETIFSDEMEPYQMDHPGQLFELWIQENASILVNGVELYWTEKGRESFHHSTQAERVPDVHACDGGNQFSIYPESPVISFRLPENASPLQYRICIDGEERPLEDVCKVDMDSFTLQMPEDDESVHLVQMIDWRNARIVYEYRFVVLGHFNCILEKDVYFDDGSPVKGIVQYNDQLYEIEALPEKYDDKDVIFVNVGTLDYDIRINVPMIHCTMGDTNLLEETRTVWHEDISKDAFVQISVPQGWDHFLNYEGRLLSPLSAREDTYEFGNFISSLDYKKDIAVLYLIVRRSDGKVDHRDLMVVAYKPQYSKDLLQLDENLELYWRPQGRIVCGKKDQFICYIHNITSNPDDDYQYLLTTKNERLYAHFDNKLGRFPYEVFLKGRKDFFKQEPDKLLYLAELTVGSEAEIRLFRKVIQLKTAKDCEYYVKGVPYTENISLAAQSARLIHFEYLGEDVPPCSEDGEAVPSFSARLYFKDQYGRRIFFNDDEHRLMYEHINPVTIWLLNDRLLYMLTVTGDPIQVDKRFGSFVNKRSQVESLGRLEQAERIRTPDLFEYIVTEEDHVI